MSNKVVKISLENNITKEQFIKQATTALEYINSKNSIVAENEPQIALLFLEKSDEYLEIDASKPQIELIPVITRDTILELMIGKESFDPEKHIKLTESTLRKQDSERRDLTELLQGENNHEAILRITEVLNSEGIFYE